MSGAPNSGEAKARQSPFPTLEALLQNGVQTVESNPHNLLRMAAGLSERDTSLTITTVSPETGNGFVGTVNHNGETYKIRPDWNGVRCQGWKKSIPHDPNDGHIFTSKMHAKLAVCWYLLTHKKKPDFPFSAQRMIATLFHVSDWTPLEPSDANASDSVYIMLDLGLCLGTGKKVKNDPPNNVFAILRLEQEVIHFLYFQPPFRKGGRNTKRSPIFLCKSPYTKEALKRDPGLKFKENPRKRKREKQDQTDLRETKDEPADKESGSTNAEPASKRMCHGGDASNPASRA